MPASSRAVAVALLLAACLVAAEAAVLTDQVEEATCEDLVSLGTDAAERCAFVRLHCRPEAMLDYLRMYYCHVAPHGVLLGAAFMVGCTALLLLLFRLMGHASDAYLSSILSQICQEMGLPPRLGGVTLLALGNGAPDLSSCIAAVKSGNYRLAMGALTGAGMFVGCVVAGNIVVRSGGVTARGAQVRDIATQFVTVLVLMAIVASRSFTYVSVAGLLALYVGYVVVVAVTDVSKRMGVEWAEVAARVAGRLPSQLWRGGGGGFGGRRGELGTPLLERRGFDEGGGGATGRVMEAGEALPQSTDAVPPRQAPPVASFEPHVTYSDLIHMPAAEYRHRALAEMAQSKSFFRRGGTWGGVAMGRPQEGAEEGLQRQQQQQIGEQQGPESAADGGSEDDGYSSDGSVGSLPPTLAAAAAAAAEGGLVQRQQQQDRQQQEQERGGGAGAHHGSDGSAASASQQSGASSSGQRQSIASMELAAPPSPLPPQQQHRPQTAAAAANGDVGGKAAELWGQVNEVLDWVQWPLALALKATIPMVDVNGYERRWLLVSLALSPTFIAAYLSLFSWRVLVGSVVAGCALSGAAYAGTQQLQGKAPLWTFGTGFPIGAALVATYGFGVAAMWISLFASEIVGLLEFFGLVSGADPSVLGVTVLAWGNSLMDFVNNTGLAERSRGGNSMAMTACFAGPLFNMLVGLGLGFWALLAEAHEVRAAVEMDPVVLAGCLFILLNCGGLVGVSLAHRQRLPGWCGWAMVGCYAAYLATVLALVVAL